MTTVADKILILREMQNRLDEATSELFPIDAKIQWRNENSFTQKGTVVAHSILSGRLILRVTDGMFHSNITLADVLRA